MCGFLEQTLFVGVLGQFEYCGNDYNVLANMRGIMLANTSERA